MNRSAHNVDAGEKVMIATYDAPHSSSFDLINRALLVDFVSKQDAPFVEIGPAS
jgi:hypothetical protein